MNTVTLVRPPSIFSQSSVTLNATPPLSLAYLAGSLGAAGIDVRAIDAVGEALDQTYACDIYPLVANGLRHEEIVERIDPRSRIVGISCLFTSEWPEVRKLCRLIKERLPDTLLVAGGEHISAEPAYSLLDCRALDVAVIGEGEETLVELAKAGPDARWEDIPGIVWREGDEIRQTERRRRIIDVDDLPLPRWDLLPLEAYLERGFSFGVNRGRTIPMLATRGCPYQCTFCSSPAMWTTRWVARDPERVADEIEGYIERYNVTNIDFYDLTAVVRKDWIIQFAQTLLDRKLDITWQLPSGTRSEALDEEVLPFLYRSGCRNLSYAPESGSERVLKRIKKKVNLDRMIGSMRTARKHGLNIKANIIFGFPGDTHRDVWASYRFIARMAVNGVNDVSIWTYSPYPGTELFEALKKAGKIGSYQDEYFAALLSYADLKNVVSWDEHLSARALRLYRLWGMLLFYATSYLSNPLRLFRTLRNLFTNQHESRMEMTLAIFLKRFSLAHWRRSARSGVPA